MHVTWIKDKTNELNDAPNGLPLMLNYLILFDTGIVPETCETNLSLKARAINSTRDYIITCISSTLATLLSN